MKRMTFIVIVLAMLLGCSERREYREALSRAEAYDAQLASEGNASDRGERVGSDTIF